MKDMEDVAGMPTTRGSVVYKDHFAERDTTHTARVRAAGAVILGKSTMSEFGFVGYTATKLHGVTRNPWDLARTPAGSSGGSAAAVAGGLVPVASGGDGGGSIRLPAAFSGLVGMKGTFGRIPRGPGYIYGPLTVTVGALCRSARDAARWFDVASGPDARDPFSLPRIDGWEAGLGKRSLRGLRAAFSADLGGAVVDPEVAAIADNAASELIDGASLHRVDINVQLPEGGRRWGAAGASSLLNELRGHWPECKEDLTREIRWAMGQMEGFRVWHAAAVDRFRLEMNEALADVFEDVDILLCPTSPVEPFPAEGPMPTQVGELTVDPYNGGALTIAGNISGYPAISVPAGVSRSGLPIGLQAYARRHEDAVLLDIAHTMEQLRPWPMVAPGAPV
jgi:aspartyl-tRNA(Asn)/glutamyl-tRNA(Gln) amidotransferase subunit A